MKLGRLLLIVLILFIAIVILTVEPAKAHFLSGRHNAVHAIQQTWCGKANKECWQGNEAIRVAMCEASALWWWKRNKPTQARNGQYRGMFQMGKDERRKYGHGPDPWTQARAAHYYWTITGKDWSPWECQP